MLVKKWKNPWLCIDSFIPHSRAENRPIIFLLFLLDDGGLLGDVEAVEELADVLVLDGRALLDEGGRLRHRLQAVPGQEQLVLKRREAGFKLKKPCLPSNRGGVHLRWVDFSKKAMFSLHSILSH